MQGHMLKVLGVQKRSPASKNITFWATKQSFVIKVILAVINIHTLVVIRRASTFWSNVGAMHIWPHARKDQMNDSTGDIITPRLVETAKWLEQKLRLAIELVIVLLVWSCALFLDRRAES